MYQHYFMNKYFKITFLVLLSLSNICYSQSNQDVLDRLDEIQMERELDKITRDIQRRNEQNRSQPEPFNKKEFWLKEGRYKLLYKDLDISLYVSQKDISTEDFPEPILKERGIYFYFTLDWSKPQFTKDKSMVFSAVHGPAKIYCKNKKIIHYGTSFFRDIDFKPLTTQSPNFKPNDINFPWTYAKDYLCG